MAPTLLSGRTDIAEFLTVGACVAAVEAAFRTHVTGQTLPAAGHARASGGVETIDLGQ